MSPSGLEIGTPAAIPHMPLYANQGKLLLGPDGGLATSEACCCGAQCPGYKFAVECNTDHVYYPNANPDANHTQTYNATYGVRPGADADGNMAEVAWAAPFTAIINGVQREFGPREPYQFAGVTIERTLASNMVYPSDKPEWYPCVWRPYGPTRWYYSLRFYLAQLAVAGSPCCLYFPFASLWIGYEYWCAAGAGVQKSTEQWLTRAYTWDAQVTNCVPTSADNWTRKYYNSVPVAYEVCGRRCCCDVRLQYFPNPALYPAIDAAHPYPAPDVWEQWLNLPDVRWTFSPK